MTTPPQKKKRQKKHKKKKKKQNLEKVLITAAVKFSRRSGHLDVFLDAAKGNAQRPELM